ncbi:MAG: O-antigen ligase family protein [Rubrivivax sp.]
MNPAAVTAPPAAAAPAERLLPALLCAAAWSPYLPLGCQYLAYLLCGVLALRSLHRAGRLGAVAADPVFRATALLWGWLALSSAWSSAPPQVLLAHLWTYGLMLWVAPIALACGAGTSRRALTHFIAASCLVALLVTLNAAGALPGGWAWRPFVDVSGNQRIAFSLQLALAAALALHLALQRRDRRPWFVAAAALCLVGLALQDRRTGMLAAPVLLATLSLAHLRRGRQRALLLLLIAAAAVAAWRWVPTVQQRLAEGLGELQAYHSDGDVTTSWGMRARMFEVTMRMAAEHPIAGHGVGSWVSQWRPRVAGSAALEVNTTPHNEYLLLLVQGGLVAWAAGLLLVLRAGRGAARRGKAGVPALLLLTALCCAGLFNVVLRDAKFALPLLLLSALAWGASRGTAQSPARRPGGAAIHCP